MTARTPTTAYPMTIYHKPNCSTSRNVLGLIRESGVEPEIVLYLETPPSKKKLLRQAPCDVLAHQFARVPERAWRALHPPRPRPARTALPSRHRDVAQPALVADAADRAAFGAAQELFFGPREQFGSCGP
jgi:hypothetical protein